MSESKMKFYVLKVVSGKEQKVREAIENEIPVLGLEQHVGRVLVPTEKVMTMRNGKKVLKERPILPGYVLVEAELVGEVQHSLRFTPNVLGFLSSKEGVPQPIQDSEVAQMLGKDVAMEMANLEIDYNFTIGEVVKIVDGPFKTCDAVVEEVFEDRKKLKVMVKVFGRKTPLELSYLEVEKE